MSLVYSGRRAVPAVKPGGVLVGCRFVELLPKRAILERAGKPVDAQGSDAKRLNCALPKLRARRQAHENQPPPGFNAGLRPLSRSRSENDRCVLVEPSRTGGIMRVLLFLTLGVMPAAAQSPTVRLLNLSHPLSSELQIGDRFAIEVTGGPSRPISVRTIRHGRADWGPVIASTDSDADGTQKASLRRTTSGVGAKSGQSEEQTRRPRH